MIICIKTGPISGKQIAINIPKMRMCEALGFKSMKANCLPEMQVKFEDPSEQLHKPANQLGKYVKGRPCSHSAQMQTSLEDIFQADLVLP